MTLNQLNTLNETDATQWFMQTCAATRWATLMANARPYASIANIETTAKNNWQTMQAPDILEAFQGHPMIGDMGSLRAKFANTKAMASNEQAGTASASEAVLNTLMQANHDYLDKHGFIFIICATGLSAAEMLAQLQLRIVNTTQDEMHNAANEQIKITLLRIQKNLTTQERTHD